MITQNEWDNLRDGDILVSPTGKERTVLRKSFNGGSMVVLSSSISRSGETAYNRTDIYRNYKIKNKNMENLTKMQVAIGDTKLRLKDVEQKIILLLREKEVLLNQVNALEIIDGDKLLQ